MMNRIDTLSSQRLWTKPAIVVEAELSDGFDNAPRRPSIKTVPNADTSPEIPQRFSNLLSLLPYLDQSKPVADVGDPSALNRLAVQEVAGGDTKPSLNAKERLQQDLAQLLETWTETQK